MKRILKHEQYVETVINRLTKGMAFLLEGSKYSDLRARYRNELANLSKEEISELYPQYCEDIS